MFGLTDQTHLLRDRGASHHHELAAGFRRAVYCVLCHTHSSALDTGAAEQPSGDGASISTHSLADSRRRWHTPTCAEGRRVLIGEGGVLIACDARTGELQRGEAWSRRGSGGLAGGS